MNTSFTSILFTVMSIGTMGFGRLVRLQTLRLPVCSAIGIWCVVGGFVSMAVLFSTARFAFAADETLLGTTEQIFENSANVTSLDVEKGVEAVSQQANGSASDPRRAVANPPVPSKKDQGTKSVERPVLSSPDLEIAVPVAQGTKKGNVPTLHTQLRVASQREAPEVKNVFDGVRLDGQSETASTIEISKLNGTAAMAHLPLAKTDPPWVPIQLNGRDGVRITVGPHLSSDDCRRFLDDELQKRTTQYVDQQLGSGNTSPFVGFDVEFIHENLIYGGVEDQLVRTSFGPMHQMTAKLCFDEPFIKLLHERWLTARREARLMQTGLGSVAVILVLSTLFAYLRLDTVTDGAFTGRLKLVGGTVILAVMASGAFIARWIPWI